MDDASAIEKATETPCSLSTSTEPSVDAIRLKICEKRERISMTAEALERKLSPRIALSPVKNRLREAMTGSSSTLLKTLEENPIAILLSAVGLGWLVYRSERPRIRNASRHPGTEGLGTQVTELGQEAAGKARGLAEGLKQSVEQVGDKAEQMTHRMGAEVHSMSLGIQRRGRHAREWATSYAEDHPFFLGAVSLALGFVLVAAIPESRGEKRVLSGLRNRFLGDWPTAPESGAPGRSSPESTGVSERYPGDEL